ncbi:hypothetical protein HN499_05835 [archaeon]|jgi:hypothetical protein|nr:hypothetical protein [archaeon]
MTTNFVIFHKEHKRETPFRPTEADLQGLKYELVARVDADEVEEAYKLTNSIHGFWGENESVTVLSRSKFTPRSTSVGDIIVQFDGDMLQEILIVAPAGHSSVRSRDFWVDKLKINPGIGV